MPVVKKEKKFCYPGPRGCFSVLDRSRQANILRGLGLSSYALLGKRKHSHVQLCQTARVVMSRDIIPRISRSSSGACVRYDPR